jgi:hypothetical protein
MTKPPEKPTDTESRLFDIGVIQKIGVSYTMTSEDDATEHIVINGKHKFPHSAFDLLIVRPDFPRSIAKVRPEILEKVSKYRNWLKKEKADLTTYHRLQKKFGSLNNE